MSERESSIKEDKGLAESRRQRGEFREGLGRQGEDDDELIFIIRVFLFGPN